MLLLSATALGQTDTVSLTVKVIQKSVSGVPTATEPAIGATVTITGKDTEQPGRRITTGLNGTAFFPRLTPGLYTVSVAKRDFDSAKPVDVNISIDVSLIAVFALNPIGVKPLRAPSASVSELREPQVVKSAKSG